MLISSQSEHLTGSEYEDSVMTTFIFKFSESGKFLAGKEFKTGYNTFNAKSFRVVDKNIVFFAGSTYGFGDLAFDGDKRSFFVMKFDFSGEIEYSCLEITDVRTNDILNNISGFKGRFDYTNDTYLNQTTYVHMQLVDFQHDIKAHTTLGMYKGEQLCYVSALVSADENYSPAQDISEVATPPTKYYVGEPAISYKLSDPLFDIIKNDY